jgi:hypothetical protein
MKKLQDKPNAGTVSGLHVLGDTIAPSIDTKGF